MSTGLVAQLILCALGTLAGAFLAAASVISIANMKVPWVAALLVAAVLLPLVWLGSGIGTWWTHGPAHPAGYRTFLILPWAYTAAVVGAMLVSFES